MQGQGGPNNHLWINHLVNPIYPWFIGNLFRLSILIFKILKPHNYVIVVLYSHGTVTTFYSDERENCIHNMEFLVHGQHCTHSVSHCFQEIINAIFSCENYIKAPSLWAFLLLMTSRWAVLMCLDLTYPDSKYRQTYCSYDLHGSKSLMHSHVNLHSCHALTQRQQVAKNPE